MKLEDIEMQTKSVAMVGVIEGGHLVTSDSIKLSVMEKKTF